MRRAVLPRAVSLLALLVAVSATVPVAAGSAAGTRSKLNVCGLVSAKQVATLSGVSSRCTNAKPLPGPGSTIYVGNWAGKTPRSPQLQISVSVYTDQGLAKLAKQNLNQGLPGVAKKVAGIGSAAYQATGGATAAIHFNVGKDVVAVTLTTIGKPPRVTPALKALAQAVAARL
jgi:hypothetical protein